MTEAHRTTKRKERMDSTLRAHLDLEVWATLEGQDQFELTKTEHASGTTRMLVTRFTLYVRLTKATDEVQFDVGHERGYIYRKDGVLGAQERNLPLITINDIPKPLLERATSQAREELARYADAVLEGSRK